MQAVVVAAEEIFERLTIAAASGAHERRVIAVIGNATSLPTPVR